MINTMRHFGYTYDVHVHRIWHPDAPAETRIDFLNDDTVDINLLDPRVLRHFHTVLVLPARERAARRRAKAESKKAAVRLREAEERAGVQWDAVPEWRRVMDEAAGVVRRDRDDRRAAAAARSRSP
jgi:hypothetical protein